MAPQNSTGLLLSLSSIIYILITVLSENVDASPQHVTFFENLGCSGENNMTFFGTTDLSNTWARNASSVKLIGVWKITIKKTLENGSTHARTITYDSQPNVGFCNERGPDWGVVDPENYFFVDVKRMGPAEMTTSEILFYTESTSFGEEYVFFESETETLPDGSVAMQSFIQFSNDSWTVYPKAGFKGKAKHFMPLGSNGLPIDAPEDYFYLNDNFSVMVGSVKKGVHDKDDDKAEGCTKAVNVVLLQMTVLTLVLQYFK